MLGFGIWNLQAAELQLAWPGSQGMAGSNEHKDSQQEQNTLLFHFSVCDLSLQHPRRSSQAFLHMAPNRRSGGQPGSFTALT